MQAVTLVVAHGGVSACGECRHSFDITSSDEVANQYGGTKCGVDIGDINGHKHGPHTHINVNVDITEFDEVERDQCVERNEIELSIHSSRDL